MKDIYTSASGRLNFARLGEHRVAFTGEYVAHAGSPWQITDGPAAKPFEILRRVTTVRLLPVTVFEPDECGVRGVNLDGECEGDLRVFSEARLGFLERTEIHAEADKRARRRTLRLLLRYAYHKCRAMRLRMSPAGSAYEGLCLRPEEKMGLLATHERMADGVYRLLPEWARW